VRRFGVIFRLEDFVSLWYVIVVVFKRNCKAGDSAAYRVLLLTSHSKHVFTDKYV
jgi:hypothetical protein